MQYVLQQGQTLTILYYEVVTTLRLKKDKAEY
jgi:hypothetical protein